MIQRLALGIEYDGSMYCGWQKQKYVPSVQGCIENAVNKITSQSVTVFCAGRTDAGVHALGQVVHFETDAQYPKSTWVFGINHYLPSSICVRWVSIVSKDFHARLSAISRRYCYVIYNDYVRSTMMLGKTWHYKKFLDINKMSKSAQCLLGRNDFSSFRSAGCQSRSTIRELYRIGIIRKGRCILINIEGNAFLYRMVRNIVGSLVEVGCGNRSETWIAELLKDCNRSGGGITAPSNGLYLVSVTYPARFFIPVMCCK